MRSILPRKLASVFVRAAHDPPKCERFGDKIMRFSQKNERATGRKIGFHFCWSRARMRRS
jgi:hypothetical protein